MAEIIKEGKLSDNHELVNAHLLAEHLKRFGRVTLKILVDPDGVKISKDNKYRHIGKEYFK